MRLMILIAALTVAVRLISYAGYMDNGNAPSPNPLPFRAEHPYFLRTEEL